MNVLAATDLDQLDPGERSALEGLLARCDQADGHAPFPEGALEGDGPGAPAARRIVLGEDSGALVGSALLVAGEGLHAMTSLHVAVDPLRRDGDARSELIRSAVAEATQPVRLWIMQSSESDNHALAPLGFAPERDLLQMRVPLPLTDEVVSATRPVMTRSFVPGQDDEAWLAVNNRAFAGHPEQGNWTEATLLGRERSDWFDADGFLVAPDDTEGGLGIFASCWTKVHRGRTPVLGEIYVISVDPSRHGEGWGRALTVAGLQWLAAQGLTVGMLYTDASNIGAVALYGHLGFTVDHVDRSYVQAGATVN